MRFSQFDIVLDFLKFWTKIFISGYKSINYHQKFERVIKTCKFCAKETQEAKNTKKYAIEKNLTWIFKTSRILKQKGFFAACNKKFSKKNTLGNTKASAQRKAYPLNSITQVQLLSIYI